MGDNYIELKNISFSYHENVSNDRKKVLENFSLSIPVNRKTVILAPSGWGKTTILFLIAGLIKPNNGDISYPFEKASFSMVFQENRLIENASIKRNLTLVQNNLSSEQIQQHLNAVCLEKSLTQKVSQLSGGEQRRLSILRALCADYDILLLDEPFTGLDDDTKQKVIDHVIQETEGKTVILVTHAIEEAQALGCNIINLVP